MRGSRYTIIFAAVLSASLAILLSGIYMALKDRQDQNRALEKQMSILSAAQLSFSSKKEAKELFASRVESLVVDKNGDVLNAVDPSSVADNSHDKFLLYVIKGQNDPDSKRYVYPIDGAGLWSRLFGYLAVDETGKKVVGITFYKQGETPGLGAEIEKSWFEDNFKGKTLFDGDKLMGIKVAKGAAKLDPAYKYQSDQLVDGISGATITGDGVTSMLLKGAKKYDPYFKKIRAKL